jgi:hypothetical protein
MEGITPDANPQYSGIPLDPPPSIRQGFGRSHLGRSLPLASNPTGWSMQVNQNEWQTNAKCKTGFVGLALSRVG